MEALEQGERNRRFGETKMNKHSSRSHALFSIVVESKLRGVAKASGGMDNANDAVTIAVWARPAAAPSGQRLLADTCHAAGCLAAPPAPSSTARVFAAGRGARVHSDAGGPGGQ